MAAAAAISIDTELVSMLMLLEMSIVMGFFSPLVPLLCLCAMLTHLCAFHIARLRMGAWLRFDAEPASDYLVFAFVLSNAFTIAFFWSIVIVAGNRSKA